MDANQNYSEQQLLEEAGKYKKSAEMLEQRRSELYEKYLKLEQCLKKSVFNKEDFCLVEQLFQELSETKLNIPSKVKITYSGQHYDEDIHSWGYNGLTNSVDVPIKSYRWTWQPFSEMTEEIFEKDQDLFIRNLNKQSRYRYCNIDSAEPLPDVSFAEAATELITTYKQVLLAHKQETEKAGVQLRNQLTDLNKKEGLLTQAVTLFDQLISR